MDNFRSNIITPDESSFRSKLLNVRSLGYYEKNRWEVSSRKCALPNNDAYCKLTLARKNPINEASKTVYNNISNKTISTNIYKNPDREYLFASVTSCNNNVDLNTYADDSFVSVYTLITDKISPVTVRGGSTIPCLDFIQLSRYDPNEQHLHQNNLSFVPNSELSSYLHYFGHSASTPHMHFASLDNNENFGNSTKNAINIFNLLDYITDLMKNEPLSTISDLNMPYKKIKDKPELYTTSIADTNLLECAQLAKAISSEDVLNNLKTSLNITKTKQSQKIFDNLLNSTNKKNL